MSKLLYQNKGFSKSKKALTGNKELLVVVKYLANTHPTIYMKRNFENNLKWHIINAFDFKPSRKRRQTYLTNVFLSCLKLIMKLYEIAGGGYG